MKHGWQRWFGFLVGLGFAAVGLQEALRAMTTGDAVLNWGRPWAYVVGLGWLLAAVLGTYLACRAWMDRLPAGHR